MKNLYGFKAMVLLGVFCFSTGPLSFAQTTPLTPVSVDKVPGSLDEFLMLRDTLANTPQGGAAVLLLALIMYTDNSSLGEQCLVISLDVSTLVEGETYKGYALSIKDREFIEKYIGKDSGAGYLPNSYVTGTEQDKGYALPAGKLLFKFYTQGQNPDADSIHVKVFVACSGADSLRPVSLVRNEKGIWKVANWHSLLVSIKPPPRRDDL